MSLFRDLLIEKKRKPYYCEVEYLESTGTQYIDTGIKLTNNHSVELDYQLTQASQSRAGLFGVLNMTGSNQGRFGSILSPSNQQLEHGYGAGNDYWQQGLPNTSRHKIYQKKNEVYFDGTLVHTFNSATFSLAVNAYLGNFVYTNYTPAKAKYYSSRWWEGGTLVRDFIPCLDFNMTPCMYDKVTRKLFYNQGTGDFSYGREIHEVEYIESTGTQWINTNVMTEAGGNYRFVLDFDYSNGSDDDTLFGGRIAGGNRSPLLYYNSVTGGFAFNYAGYNSQQSPTNTINVSTDERHVFDLSINDTTKKSNVIVDGTAYYSNISYSGNIYSGYPIGVFCDYASGTAIELASYKLYSFVIYKDEEAIRDYIPAIDENDIFYMFDKVTHTVYTNAGTGSFIGPTVEKDGNGKVIESRWF